MASAPPVIIILYGDNEFEIEQTIQTIQEKMGDPSMASMNTTRLDGRRAFLDELRTAAYAIPFLVNRRLVILESPLSQCKSKDTREKFVEILEKTPDSTALVVIEHQDLNPKNKPHWLLKWGRENKQRVHIRDCTIPRGREMEKWIRQQAKQRGGEFTQEAAGVLASLVVDEPRIITNEIEKLLAYANYQRAVEPDDVEYLTAPVQQPNIFDMVDAVGSRNERLALELLHKLLDERDPLSIFAMITRQFRLLLLAREQIDLGALQHEVASTLKIHPFVAQKLSKQAQNFELPVLEAIFRRLVEVDHRIKTGQVDGITALDTLIMGLTQI